MSTGSHLYTDHDAACCAVLSARVADGSLPPGDVLCADVRSLTGQQLRGYSRVDLFAGIGGSPLGFAWAGWPEEWSLLTGGFPCQDISSAGKGAGLTGARSGLFFEIMRLLKEQREAGDEGPFVCLLENVGALSARGLDRVAREMESLGYWVECYRVGAWAVGSPQHRERWWFVCVRRSLVEGMAEGPHEGGRRLAARQHGDGRAAADADGRGQGGGGHPSHVADEPLRRCHEGAGVEGGERGTGCGGSEPAADGAGSELAIASRSRRGQHEPRRVPQGGASAGRSGEGGELVHAGGGGLRAERVGEARPVADKSDPRRWPHPLWVDGDGNVIPTPQHDWEPPRLFPGTSTINARWRLALMGYPLHWLDVPDAALASLAGARSASPLKLARWWNREGIKQTGNCQCPQNVAALARGLIDALRDVARRAVA